LCDAKITFAALLGVAFSLLLGGWDFKVDVNYDLNNAQGFETNLKK
jgi:hypothetical protein